MQKNTTCSTTVYTRVSSATQKQDGTHMGALAYHAVPSRYTIVRSVEVEGTTGATVVRNRDNIKGLPHLPPPLQRQVDRSNELVRRTVTIARAIML
mmetsp:Transcript_31776/g.93614  ORF Transcript_31776/g.93614 Transcript_31776/m.93614 type:complete len:96 (-) Transcript_31776:545-832(-)